MKSNTCSKCGSTDQKRGNFFARGDWVGFRDEDAAPLFTFREKVMVLVCNACGYVEVFLKESEKRTV